MPDVIVDGVQREATPAELAAFAELSAAAPLVPESISDRQFFQQLAVENVISEQEAEDAVASGAIPAEMAELIKMLPGEQQFAARMLVRGATELLRTHPMTNLIGTLYGWDAAKIDKVWIDAARL